MTSISDIVSAVTSSTNPYYPARIPDIEGRLKNFRETFKSSHLMMIKGVSVLYRKEVTKIESSVFEIFDHKWKLILYPTGEYNPRDHVSLHLKMEDANSSQGYWLFESHVRLSVLNLFAVDEWHKVQSRVHFNPDVISWRVENFMPLSMFKNGYGWKDVAIFGVEIAKRGGHNFPRTKGTAECVTMVEMPEQGKLTWKITKFSSFNQPNHFSHPFSVGRRKWKIEMYPKGALDQKVNGGLEVRLTPFEYLGNAPKAATYAKFKLRVIDQFYGAHREKITEHCFDAPNVGYGFRDLITHKELYDDSKGFLINDTIYIGVEFLVISTTHHC